MDIEVYDRDLKTTEKILIRFQKYVKQFVKRFRK